VPNPQSDTNYVVRFAAPEFTSICPVTGQPDFAHLVIDYVPGQWLLESKSLKLYVASFRNHGAFHEDCTVMIGKRISAEIKPKWLRIGGYWYPRGGIPIAGGDDPAGIQRVSVSRCDVDTPCIVRYSWAPIFVGRADVAIGPRLQRVIPGGHRRVQREATPVSSCLKRIKFLLTWATLLWFALKQVYEFKGVYYAWMVS
jgi:7-cyano-7-deazaguanine reductase